MTGPTGWLPPGTIAPLESDGGVARLRATGEFDLANEPELASALERAVTSGHKLVEVDLSAVTFLDVCSVHTLVRCHAIAAGHGCVLRIVNPTGTPALILDGTGTRELLCGTSET